jgi:hypothetical protein
MSLWGYGVVILGVVLGGLVLLVIFSLMAMARKGDESLERLELARLRPPTSDSLPGEKSPGETHSAPAASDAYNLSGGGAA